VANPFNFGDLALDQGFADREEELRELLGDMRNGQNVVIFAPRRYGKSSLLWRAAQELLRDGMLIAQVDLMRTTTKEQLAAALSKAIFEDIATPLYRARERAAEIFRGLRARPVMTIDSFDGSVGFSIAAGHASADVDATIERLLELPAELAPERKRRVALVFDEFQEILAIDSHLPALMRSVFQAQPDVSHVYLGSKRALMHRLFHDVNEPFWRSARQMELGPIPGDGFTRWIRARFEETGRHVAVEALARVLEITGGHPYATQELCYWLWDETDEGAEATSGTVDVALDRVLRTESAHFTRIWDTIALTQRLVLQAVAQEPPEQITSTAYRARHGLPAASSVQKAVAALTKGELLVRHAPGTYAIAEPFLAEWVRRYGS
jgi:uncharacterized protein